MDDYFAKRDCFEPYRHIASRALVRQRRSENVHLTIAIPTYKRPTLLDETLASVKRQTANPESFEVVVVDNDPAGDDAAAIAQITKFGFTNFTYYRNCENLTALPNWNRCIELARTERMTILHDDDEIEPEFVARMIELAPRDPRALWSCDFAVRLDTDELPGVRHSRVKAFANNLIHRLRNGKLRRLSLEDYFFWVRRGGTLGIVFDRQCAIDLGGFDMGHPWSADFLFFSQYAYLHGGYLLYEKLAKYRIGFNDSMRLSTMLNLIQNNHHFRQYAASLLFPAALASPLSKLLTALDAWNTKRYWSGSFDRVDVTGKLGVAPPYNAIPFILAMQIFILCRSVVCDIASRRA